MLYTDELGHYKCIARSFNFKIKRSWMAFNNHIGSRRDISLYAAVITDLWYIWLWGALVITNFIEFLNLPCNRQTLYRATLLLYDRNSAIDKTLDHWCGKRWLLTFNLLFFFFYSEFTTSTINQLQHILICFFKSFSKCL